ncbi:MAG: glycosyltransferase family 2 protein [Deltaproteobacteria bacterium]|nr:glycosyltransferase family 2 protein [Deltaproteobacteria bacterium]
MERTRPQISAIVVCLNEEDNIRACLESVSWCDEVVVVDARSTDRTREIVREFTDRIFVRDWPGYREQKQFALDQARLEWVLNLDADERVSPELHAEIQRELADGAPGVDGFYVPRLVHYLGRWWYRGGWYPDYRLRLFRRRKATWGGVNPHEKVLVRGRTRRLSGSLLHFTYADVSQHLLTVNRLTDISAVETLKRGAVKRRRLLVGPAWRFFRSLVIDRGVLEGWPGLFVAATAGFYVFLKYAKALELSETRSA